MKKIKDDLLKEIQEIQWAHIFHDSIKDLDFLNTTSINVGRWAGNYSFFYILGRILKDFQPKSILELGLGESSKFISSFLNNCLKQTSHTVVEQDEEFIKYYKRRNTGLQASNIIHLPLQEKHTESHKFFGYRDVENIIKQKFELYLVDGPHGSDRFSRYDIVNLLSAMESNDEFIVLIDDTNRKGERDTLESVMNLLSKKNITYFHSDYQGNKTNSVVATSKYKFCTTL
jgi:hypothetical protein